MRRAWLLAFVLAGCTPSPPPYPLDDVLTLADVQLLATHNSYHVASPASVPPWEYTEKSLSIQLENEGVRGLELDVHYDAAMDHLRVFHVTGYDPGTTCLVFTDCLESIAAWSRAHPRHHALFVQVEPKIEGASPDPGPFFAMLEREILSVFSRDEVVTPDDVQGDSPTLRDAVKTRGWPKLGATRGKVLFYLDNNGDLRAAYTHDLTDLRGRLLFANSTPADAWAGIAILNDPIGQKADIAAALAAGMIVRTRTDVDTDAARDDDTRQRDAAFASGAQIVSTDFPAKVPEFDYFVQIPGGTPSRCDPITAPKGCTSADVETPDALLPPKD